MSAYKKNHLHTKALLENWAGPEGQLRRVCLEKGLASEGKKPENAGYRLRFFENREIARKAEQRFNRFESLGMESLNRLGDSWPPKDRERTNIAALVAIHMVRNPAFVEATMRLAGEHVARVLPEQAETLSPSQLKQFTSYFEGEPFRVEHMLDLLPKHASLIASMHWSVLEFSAPLLATSDQPVTITPLLIDGDRAPLEVMPKTGYIATEEMRFPISPYRALLFTWINDLDSERPIMPSDEIAAELNRATIGQADREWFHHPARRATRLMSDDFNVLQCSAVGRLLIPGYDTNVAKASPRRAHTLELLNGMIENQVTDAFHVASVARVAA